VPVIAQQHLPPFFLLFRPSTVLVIVAGQILKLLNFACQVLSLSFYDTICSEKGGGADRNSQYLHK
jgi:hypothetical protein